MPNPLVRRGAMLAATAATLAVAAPAAFAQTPPTAPPAPPAAGPPAPGPPLLPPLSQPADLSIHLDRDSANVDEGERFDYTAHVTNNGPGTAKGATVIVSTPEEFDLDDTNQEDACESNKDDEGRMVCRFGDLPANGGITLHFRGDFHGVGNHRAHAYVVSDSPDPDWENNAADRRVEVLREVLDCRLTGGDADTDASDSTGDGIEVNNDLEVRLSGDTLLRDDNGVAQFAPGGVPVGEETDPLDPVRFKARAGERLRIIAKTNPGTNRFLDPLFLECDGSDRKLTDGEDMVTASERVFFDRVFRIRDN